MRAVEYDAYGSTDVLAVRAVEEPGAPAPGEIRVRTRATSVNPKDTFVRKGRFKTLTDAAFPKRVGYDWAGTIEAAGDGVTALAAGDVAFGMIDGWSGGTCAEIINVPAAASARVTADANLEELAATPLAAQTALQALVDVAAVETGARVLVNGASGGVGLFALQIARELGAHVTARSSAASADLCLEYGAHAYADYARGTLEDAGGPFDVVFDVFGNLAYDDAANVLTDRGILVSTVPSPATFAAIAATRERTGKRAALVNVRSRAADLARLSGLYRSGRLRVHLDRVFALDDIAAAHAHVEASPRSSRPCRRT